MSGGVRILLVDDDQRYREQVADVLEKLDDTTSVTPAASAEDALDRLETGSFDCVVSDYRMPETNGIGFAAAVRESWPHLPFVLVTGQGSEEVASEAFSVGVSEYFRKGADLQLLLERVHNLVERSRAERSRQETKARYEALIEESPDLLASVTADGTISYQSESLRRMLGIDPGDVIGQQVFDLIHPDDHERARAVLDELAAADATDEPRLQQLTLRLRDADGEWRWIEATARTTDAERIDGFVVNSRDVTERRRREAAIRALHDATREMMSAQDRGAVESVTVDAATEVLDLDLVAAYRFDDDAGRLEPTAWSDGVEDTFGVPPTFERGEGLVWRAFASGETLRFDDVTGEEDVYNDDTPVRSELIVPVGTNGVFLTGSTEAGTIDDVEVDEAEVLCANAEAAIEQLEQRRQVRGRDRIIDRHRSELDQLAHVLSVARTALRTTVEADDRAEIEAGICDHLTTSEPYRFAWLGRVDATGDRLEVAAHSGVEKSYPEALTVRLEDDPGVTPAARAAATGEVTVVDDALEDGGRREDALHREYRSVAGIPIHDDGWIYGALELYASEAERFGDRERAVFADLGRAVGTAISVADQRASIAGDLTVKATYRIDCETLFHWRLSEDLGCTVRHRGTAATEGDTDWLFVEVPDATPSEIKSAETVGYASSVQVVTEDPTVVRVDTTAPVVVPAVRDHGGRLRSLAVEAGRGELAAAFVRRRSVRDFVDDVSEYADAVELLRCETIDDPTTNRVGRPLNDLRERLTDRQRELLQAAYLGGYFDRTRQISGEDLAETFDLNHSTVYGHLRAGQRRLLEALFEPEEGHGE